MQDFWWNRKFYHGKEEPDSFRLHRLEEEQATVTSAVEALSQAQAALDGLLDTYGTILSEHSSLLADLTAICEGLKNEVQAVSAECTNIGSELLALETTDEALTARIDAVEETCADTAAEQSTKITAAEEALVLQDTRLTAVEEQLPAQEARIAAVETELPVLSNAVADIEPFLGGVETAQLYGDYTIIATLTGKKYGSPMTHYAADGTVTSMYLSGDTETVISLPKGGNWLFGKIQTLAVQGGAIEYFNLSGMPSLKKLTIKSISIGSIDIPKDMCLSELHLDSFVPIQSAAVDFSRQTEISKLTMRYVYVNVTLPTQPKNLTEVTVDDTRARNKAFWEMLLPDRTGMTAGVIHSPIEISYPVFAERNWNMEVG